MKNIWWRNAVGYQIYIRSFFDYNNDGYGDLKGITKKLKYLKSLGIDFIWICPFYDSPMDDNGYDIRDYYKVDKIYGHINDLKKLIKLAHELNIKVCIDLVMNHTSDENEWFVKSENKVEPYTDFYVWKDGRMVDGKLQPPNNWLSFFSGSAWKYSEKRKQYFLKIFSEKMPDINYESEIAFEEMEKVIAFYKELGVDGFRVDAISHIGKDLSFIDYSSNEKYYKRFSNLPNTHEYLKRFNKIFTKYNLVTMGELGGDPAKEDILEYTTQNELDMVFSFEHFETFNNNHTINREGLYNSLINKNKASDDGAHPMLFWCNHDQPRLYSKVDGETDPKNAQICLATLMYFLKGTPIVYNGEEIGMTNYPFKKEEDFKDINAKLMFKNSDNKQETLKNLIENSRDHSRTVMQWDESENAGFSSGVPQSYVNSNYKDINVENQKTKKSSMLSIYKKIIKLRKDLSDVILNGEYGFFKNNDLIGYTIKNVDRVIKITANLSNKKLKRDKNTNVLFSNLRKCNHIKPYEIIIEEL